jgi:hypothetical protein
MKQDGNLRPEATQLGPVFDWGIRYLAPRTAESAAIQYGRCSAYSRYPLVRGRSSLRLDHPIYFRKERTDRKDQSEFHHRGHGGEQWLKAET